MMDIYRAEREAQDRMHKNPKWDKSFVLVGPGGVMECEWLDPYFGLFQIKGHEGAAMSKQVPPTCHVIMPDLNEDSK